VNRLFVADLLASQRGAAVPADAEALDLGTGTAQIPIELCRQNPQARVRAVDLAGHMLELARQNVAQSGFDQRIVLAQVDAKGLPYADGAFRVVISNSIVHHIPEPRRALAEAWRVLAVGGLIFFRDLARPYDGAELQRLVDTYAADCNRQQRQLFEASLRAALSVEEIHRLVAELGSDPSTAQATSDRHWTWSAVKR
jgi:ubiquinone/menaquinone biosynthesis C-methylase UbiE